MRTRLLAAALTAALLAGGCSTASGSPGAHSGAVRVLAAENMWGSIAAQVGGSRVSVTNIIDSPAADPHDYEPTTVDGRAVAMADLVIVNGLGYDEWASRLAAANNTPGQSVLDIGARLGAVTGSNPHRWYNPDDVTAFARILAQELSRISPADSAYFTAQETAFETKNLAPYKAIISAIRTAYHGRRIGASESIVSMIAPALGLDLVTPRGFLQAISDGNDPSATDKAVIDTQIASKQIAVYVYNSQNATPDVQLQITAAKRAGIPVTTMTETLTPPNVPWQDWQITQLTALREALATSAGR